MDLILWKFPIDVCMAHHLPGLVNNLLSGAILCDMGCEVYFHRTGCEVSFNGQIILRG
jgi:hypothetical protein